MNIRLFFIVGLVLISLLLLSGTVLHALLSFWFGDFLQAMVSVITSIVLISLYSIIITYCK